MIKEIFEAKTRILLGKRIYHITNSVEVYQLKKYPGRVVKIEQRPSEQFADIKSALRIIRQLKNKNYSAVVKIHQIGSFTHPNFDTIYYYVMDKLQPLKIKNRYANVKYLRYHLHPEYGDEIPNEKIKIHRKVKSFLKRAQQITRVYTDIHEYNLMVDRHGTIKFIDLESFIF